MLRQIGSQQRHALSMARRDRAVQRLAIDGHSDRNLARGGIEQKPGDALLELRDLHSLPKNAREGGRMRLDLAFELSASISSCLHSAAQ